MQLCGFVPIRRSAFPGELNFGRFQISVFSSGVALPGLSFVGCVSPTQGLRAAHPVLIHAVSPGLIQRVSG